MTQEITADRKKEAERQLAAAKERAFAHSRDVIDPEIKKLTEKLIPKLDNQDVRFTASLDGRFLHLDPERPYPDVQPRQYRVKVTSFGNSIYISVDYWHENGAWDGPRSQGRPGWTHAEGWHKLQALEFLAKHEPRRDPETWPDAMHILVAFCERAAAEGKLTTDEAAALNTVQCHHRDKAMYRNLYAQ